jgi:hypothetical protein
MLRPTLRFVLLERVGLHKGKAQQFINDVVLFVIRPISHQLDVVGNRLVDIFWSFARLTRLTPCSIFSLLICCLLFC